MKKNVLCLCDNTPDTPWECMGVYTLKFIYPNFIQGFYSGLFSRVLFKVFLFRVFIQGFHSGFYSAVNLRAQPHHTQLFKLQQMPCHACLQ